MQINHNIRAMVTQHALFQNNNAMTKSLEKLSTGLKINRAQDDAAGLAMSEQMRTQIRGLGKAKQNAQDGQAALQIAEGALAEITNMMQRQRELAIQAANETLTSTERMYLDDEFQALTKEIKHIASNTDYNGKNVLLFDRDPDKSFGATKLNPYNSEISFLEAANVIYKVFGASLNDGGLSPVSLTVSAANSSDAFAVSINKAIASINAVITKLNEEDIGMLVEGNIVQVLTDILSIGAVNLGDGITLGGDAIHTNLVSIVGTLQPDHQTATNMAVIKKANDFLRAAADALVDFEAAKSGEMDNKKGAFSAINDILSGTYSGIYNSDNRLITTDDQTFERTNISALDRIIGAIEEIGTSLAAVAEINKFGSIFGANASVQMQKDIMTVMQIDTNKMQTSDAKEQVMVWQKTIAALQDSYKVYAESNIEIGTAASEVLHVGPNYSRGLGGPDANEIKVNYTAIDIRGLGLQAQGIDSKVAADRAIDRLDSVIKVVSGNRAAIGTYINRLDYTVNNIASMQYNIQDAESRIRDTDFSQTTTDFTRNQIMVQSATSMLAQANNLPQAVLSLLG